MSLTSSHSADWRSAFSTISAGRLPASRRVSFSPASTFSRIDIDGNGFGFWNTMPTRRRKSTGSTSSR